MALFPFGLDLNLTSRKMATGNPMLRLLDTSPVFKSCSSLLRQTNVCRLGKQLNH